MHISVDAVNVMAAYQPVVLTCVHSGGRKVTISYVFEGHLVSKKIYEVVDDLQDAVLGEFPKV